MKDLYKKLDELTCEFNESGTTFFALSSSDKDNFRVDFCGDLTFLDTFFRTIISWFGNAKSNEFQKNASWSLVKSMNRALNEDSDLSKLLGDILNVDDIDAFEEELVEEEEEENDELDKMGKKFDVLKVGICKLANLIEKLSNMLVETQDSKNSTKKK